MWECLWLLSPHAWSGDTNNYSAILCSCRVRIYLDYCNRSYSLRVATHEWLKVLILLYPSVQYLINSIITSGDRSDSPIVLQQTASDKSVGGPLCMVWIAACRAYQLPEDECQYLDCEELVRLRPFFCCYDILDFLTGHTTSRTPLLFGTSARVGVSIEHTFSWLGQLCLSILSYVTVMQWLRFWQDGSRLLDMSVTYE